MEIIKYKVDFSKYTDKSVDEKINYQSVNFLQQFILACIDKFSHPMEFRGCIFEETFQSYSVGFGDDLIFENVIFKSKFDLTATYVTGDLIFDNCIFQAECEIIDSTIHGKTSFNKCRFYKGINLFSKEQESFGNVAFEGGLNIFG